MKLFSSLFVYCCFSHGTCTLFFLCLYIDSFHICIAFLNMLPSIFSSHFENVENVVKRSESVYTRE